MAAPSVRRRVAVFFAALLVQAAAGSPPNGPPARTWLEWLAGQPQRLARLGLARTGNHRLQRALTGALTTMALLGLPRRLPGLTAASHLPGPLTAIIQTLGLAATFNLLAADRAASRIDHALAHDDLDTARAECAALTGRPAQHLTPSEIADLTIAALATYPSHALLGPWLAYALFDLPAALVYRLADALGAAWGGAGPWLPWRLLRLPGRGAQQRIIRLGADQGAALALIAAAPVLGYDPTPGLAGIDQAAEQEREIPPDIAAMAGLLGLALQTDNALVNPTAPPPTPADIASAQRLARVALAVLTAAVVVVLVVATTVDRRRSDGQ